MKLGVVRICLLGSIGKAYRPYLPERFAPYLTQPRHDALDGAILLAGGRAAPMAATMKQRAISALRWKLLPQHGGGRRRGHEQSSLASPIPAPKSGAGE